MATAAGAARCLFQYSFFPISSLPKPEATKNSDSSTSPSPSPPIIATALASLLNSAGFPASRSFGWYRFRYAPLCLASDLHQEESNPSPDLAILLEVEGVLVDIYRIGNQKAFNVAFQNLGLDCANWTEPIYADLLRKSAGDEERMLILFFNRVGWPTSLPTNEKETFIKNVLREKRKALEDYAMSTSLTLRPGVENFIDEALNQGVPVVLLTSYGKHGEKTSRSIVQKLGQERISKVKVIGKEEVEQSFYGQLVLGKGVSSSLDEQLAKEVQKAASMEKQRIAEEVASILKLSIDLDTSSSESTENIISTLRAGAEYAGSTVENCVLIAGSQVGVHGAERIGMPCVVVRSSLTTRAEFGSAKLVMDGFCGADLTISKLRNNTWSTKR